MPIMGPLGGYKPDKEALAKAKGKNGSSLANDIFAASNDIFYEFGLITRPKNKEKEEE